LTPYQFASNTPIQAVDLDGLEAFRVTSTDLGNGKTTFVIAMDHEIQNNFSHDFQVTWSDGEVTTNGDWRYKNLQYLSKQLVRGRAQFDLNGQIMPKHSAHDIQLPDKSIGQRLDAFHHRVDVATSEIALNDYDISVDRNHNRALIFADDSAVRLDDGTYLPYTYDNFSINLVRNLEATIGKFDYNGIEIYVPNEFKGAVLNQINEAGLDPNMVIFTEEQRFGSWLEILPVKITKTVKEVKPSDE
jgi:hypothetical protein